MVKEFAYSPVTGQELGQAKDQEHVRWCTTVNIKPLVTLYSCAFQAFKGLAHLQQNQTEGSP